MPHNTKVITCGCRFNRFESAEIRANLAPAGAPVVVINTCAVTRRSEAKSRNAIRRAVRENPGSAIVVAGCWAELDPEAARAIEGVTLVLGNEEKLRGGDYLNADGTVHTGAVRSASVFLGADAALMEKRTAAYLKIQNGCDETCSFCVVRLVRGKGRSARPEEVLEKARGLIARGAREIVLTGINIGQYGRGLGHVTLTGINIGQYGRGLGHVTLAALLEALAAIPGPRIRISSINPLDITSELLAVMARHPAICRHLHIPLQSGSDAVLARMERPYTAAIYRERALAAAAALPGLGLGCDVMAGFPGETETDLEASAALLRELPFSYAHVFSYSPRPQTPASRFGGEIPEAIVKERAERLKAIAAMKNRAFRQSLAGGVHEVLVEQKRTPGGRLTGKTGSFAQIEFEGNDTLKGTIIRVKAEGLTQSGLHGVVA